jgi:hypothetical protein
MNCTHPPECLVEETTGGIWFEAGALMDTEQVIVVCTQCCEIVYPVNSEAPELA